MDGKDEIRTKVLGKLGKAGFAETEAQPLLLRT